MPRYIVQRTFSDGLDIALDEIGAKACRGVIDNNTAEGVTWVTSYVSHDKTRTFCVYDAPSPEAILSTAATNNLPVDEITPVQVLDPYFYTGVPSR